MCLYGADVVTMEQKFLVLMLSVEKGEKVGDVTHVVTNNVSNTMM